LLRGRFGAQQTVGYKGKVDIVTEVDERAEQVIREILLSAFPTYGMLAEEGGELSGEDDACWVVYPLDGPTNYAHGLPIFSVWIDLERRGEAVLGVVHDPMRDETYVVERGEGATLHGEPIAVSDTGDLIQSLLVTGFPNDQDQVLGALDLFGRFTLLSQSMRKLGSAALDLCYVASGRLDGY
jgi:myo-inositol-1(or 4)-monophosphatase